MVKFTDKHGNVLEGTIKREYKALEGDTRYIIKVGDIEYRCKKVDDEYVELII